jgi:hypothetical protein
LCYRRGMHTRRSWLAPLLGVLALSGSGCGKFRDLGRCHGVVRDINAAVDEIEALSKAKPVDEPRIAQRYAQLAKSLEARAQGEQSLPLALRDHIVVLRATEAAIRNHDSLRKAGSPRISEARRELERLVKREHATAARVEVACHN